MAKKEASKRLSLGMSVSGYFWFVGKTASGARRPTMGQRREDGSPI